jgi:urea carboxylase
MFRKVLIANRGAIACRIERTLRRMGIASVAVYSDADRHALHVAQADEAVRLGTAPAADSYLRADRIIEAALTRGAEAVHPGYGFLSEDAQFADAVRAAGLVFIGPTPDQMRSFGLKHRAREIAAAHDVPLLPGSGLLESFEQARMAAARIGYPLMLKSTAGGGGIGMQRVQAQSELRESFEAVERLAKKNFNRGGMFLEKYITRARHIEVQIFGNGHEVVALGERDCSTQRRNQKIIEETPAPHLPEELRRRLFEAAVRLGRAVNYRSAGTVEFVCDAESLNCYFLEVNTRLQVEHGVTEEVTGIDLVEWMIREAAGEVFPLLAQGPAGAAIQVRVYAEDPGRQFQPSSGLLTHARFPATTRVETWVQDGTVVTPFYDPLLAKVIARGADRATALQNLRRALEETVVSGIETNLGYLRQLTADPLMTDGLMTTRSLEAFAYAPRTVEVLSGGTQTTIQDYPGRVGYWNVGVPPSGPMDDWSFRLANRALGNPAGAAALEITVSGPTLKFNADTIICLAGAMLEAELSTGICPWGRPVKVSAGEVLRLGSVRGAGCRAYLTFAGGLEVPTYLGSSSTFTLGKFGGHGGRALQAGDVLHLPGASSTPPCASIEALMPAISNAWEIGVLSGPHGAPDFFTAEDIETLFAATWEVHYNSSRTGIRLLGPKPVWARSDGGEAGLHPSNIHDNAYALGAVDFTGDMPVILGPDGPSLGGFVCPVTVVKAERWKLGQLRANDLVRFRLLSPEQALAAERAQDEMLASLRPLAPPPARPGALGRDAVLATLAPSESRPLVVYRRAGDKYLLVEYGPPVLDLSLRFRVHALSRWLEIERIAGIIDLTPGIRSLQVHFDSRVLPVDQLLERLAAAETQLGCIDDLTIDSRIVYLPLSWDDASTRLAIEKYMQSVRADAPWCPSNIEFIRRINGLDSIEEVKRIVFEATYLVLGLGDVYLGAPVATPLDPRHRLVTTKYNPARTFTPENAVGIGGAYLCVYGMEGPGGYQFVGRTCQMWNTYRVTREFAPGSPWLLRHFDQIRFRPVSGEELLEFREDFLYGGAQLEVQNATLSLREYREFLAQNAPDIAAHKQRQQAAFEAERARWEASGQIGYAVDMPAAQQTVAEEVAPGHLAVASPVSGSVWKIASSPGQQVKAGETLVLVESMKMELPVTAPVDGTITELRCAEGRAVLTAQTLLVLRPSAAPSPV